MPQALCSNSSHVLCRQPQHDAWPRCSHHWRGILNAYCLHKIVILFLLTRTSRLICRYLYCRTLRITRMTLFGSTPLRCTLLYGFLFKEGVLKGMGATSNQRVQCAGCTGGERNISWLCTAVNVTAPKAGTSLDPDAA